MQAVAIHQTECLLINLRCTGLSFNDVFIEFSIVRAMTINISRLILVIAILQYWYLVVRQNNSH